MSWPDAPDVDRYQFRRTNLVIFVKPTVRAVIIGTGECSLLTQVKVVRIVALKIPSRKITTRTEIAS
jgi:hypothetical protein